MDQEQISIDINTADEASLTQLQGIGTYLAKRIIEGRPFKSIDDLTRVRGLSENDVERLRPFLSITGVLEGSPDPDLEEAVNQPNDNIEGEVEAEDEIAEVTHQEDSHDDSLVFDQEQSFDEVTDVQEPDGQEQIDLVEVSSAPQDEGLPSPSVEEQTQSPIEQPEEVPDRSEIDEQKPEAAEDLGSEPPTDDLKPVEDQPIEQPAAQPGYITRGGACGLIFIGAILTLLLGVAATLGILSGINQGRLEYASPSQITTLQSQIDTLTTQSQTLADDIVGMRNRIDNLESLSGQVSEMEIEINDMQQQIGQLQEQVAANQAAYDDLSLQIEDIETQIEVLISQGDRFESFLDGLRTLMEGLFPQTPQVEETP
ncbi:MAG: ComEA family DNA-binding protein [Anaerolineales bacterium]|jgi:ribosomal protein S13/chaperonin cofactor prefoldin